MTQSNTAADNTAADNTAADNTAADKLKTTASIGGAVAAAIAASACCIGPLILAILGIGGAGFLVALEPYRPIFTTITVLLLGAGWYLTYRQPKHIVAASGAAGGGVAGGGVAGGADDCGCAMPKANKLGKRMLWFATAVVVIALGFPYLTPYLF